jgi:two-component system, response regulator PdtaR
MSETLRVVIADDEPRMREFFSKSIDRLGHQVVGMAATGRELVECCQEMQPDLIITDIKMEGMDGIDAAAALYAERPVPVILVSAFHDEDFIERARENHIMAYLLKPIKDSDLIPAIGLATARFREYQMLREQAESSKQALEDRKHIERAKGILMKRAGLEEPDAFRRLQKHANSRRVKLVEMAKTIIAAEETLNGD